MAKPKIKLGKYASFYLSNQSIAIILKFSNGKKSQFIDKVLYEFYKKEEENKEKENINIDTIDRILRVD